MPTRLCGELDAAALGAALRALVARHGQLRTSFDRRTLFQRQAPAPAHDGADAAWLCVRDLEVEARAASAEGGAVPSERAHALLARALVDEALRPMDAFAWPPRLFTASILRLGAREHVLLLNLHHLIDDGGSVAILFDELWPLYRALRAGASVSAALSALGAPPGGYDCFVCRQEQAMAAGFGDEWDAWRARYGTRGVPLPDLRLAHALPPACLLYTSPSPRD